MIQNLSYKKAVTLVGTIFIVILLVALAPLLTNRGDSLTIAGKLGAEPSIITNMYKILIEEETDYNVNVEDGLGKTSFLFNALESDDIDGYLEFTGTVLGELVNIPPESNEAEAVYNQANTALDEQYDMTMLEPMAFNNNIHLL